MSMKQRGQAQADPAVQNLALHIFLSAAERGLHAACLVAQNSPAPTAHIGADAFSNADGTVARKDRHPCKQPKIRLPKAYFFLLAFTAPHHDQTPSSLPL